MIEVWLGISTDEVVRVRDARDRWQVNRYPLIESQMSRSRLHGLVPSVLPGP